MANSVATSFGVSGAVGSSMMMRRLSEASARAISTICWSAMDRPRIGRVTSMPDAEQVHEPPGVGASSRPMARGRAAPPSSRPEHEVLGHRQVGEGDRLLVDQRDAQLLRGDGARRSRPSRPFSASVPRVGRWTPAMILAKVDLPAPFSPSKRVDFARHRGRGRHRAAPRRRRTLGDAARGQQAAVMRRQAVPARARRRSISPCALRSDQKPAGICAPQRGDVLRHLRRRAPRRG